MFIEMLEIEADVVGNVNAELFLKVFHGFDDVMFNLEEDAKWRMILVQHELQHFE